MSAAQPLPVVLSPTGKPIGTVFHEQTPAETSAGVTPTNYQYEPGEIYRYGTNTTPGVTDMRAALMAAYAQAIQQGGTGAVYFPPDMISIQSACSFGSAVLLKGVRSAPAGGLGNNRRPLSIVLKQFSGDLFTFTGADGAVSGPGVCSGGGVQDLRLVNDSGSSITAGGDGSAIVVTGSASAAVPSWFEVRNCIIEYASARDSWTWAINCDGTAVTDGTPGLPTLQNFFITETHTHTASSSGGALRLFGYSGFICDCSFHDISGHADILVSGTAGVPSGGVYFDGVNTSGDVTLDRVYNISWMGGLIGGNVTNTANTAGRSFFFPAQMSTEFLPSANNAGGNFTLVRPTNGTYSAVSGGVQMSNPLILFNAQAIHGETASRANAPGLIELDANDRVLIARNGSDIQIGRALVAASGGGTATLGAIGSGPATTTMNSWAKFYDSTGAAFYVPVWK